MARNGASPTIALRRERLVPVRDRQVENANDESEIVLFFSVEGIISVF
tara:strand:+ start:518 stop:661 length:144 start_codon:yes stop_codon:yes gene_type:complete